MSWGLLSRHRSKAGARYQAGYCRSTGGRARCAPGPGDPSPSPARASSPARPALGGVDSVMSPGLALRQVGSRGSSAGGFRRAGLARREAGRTASRRARIAQAGPGARRSVSRRPTPFRSRPRTSCPGPRRPAGAAPVIPGRVPRRGDPPAAGRRHPLRRPPAVRGTATRQARGGGAVPGRVRSSGTRGSGPGSSPRRSVPDVPRVPCTPSEPELGALVQSTGGSVVQICHKGPDRAGAPEKNR